MAESTPSPGLDSHGFLVSGPGPGLGLRSHPKSSEAAGPHRARLIFAEIREADLEIQRDALGPGLKVVVVDCSARHWWKHARRL